MRVIAIAACLFALAACTPERAPPEPSAGAEVAPAEESPSAGSQYAPIERAKQVEPEVLDAKKAQDAEIEAQGG